VFTQNRRGKFQNEDLKCLRTDCGFTNQKNHTLNHRLSGRICCQVLLAVDLDPCDELFHTRRRFQLRNNSSDCVRSQHKHRSVANGKQSWIHEHAVISNAQYA